MATLLNLVNGCAYRLADVPDVVDGVAEGRAPEGRITWRSTYFAAPPAVGTRVEITFNGFGFGEVESYFVEHGFLGVAVKLDKEPEWRRKTTGIDHSVALVFGNEIKPQ